MLDRTHRKTTGGTDDAYDHAGNVVSSHFSASSGALESGGRDYHDYKWWIFDAAGRTAQFREFTGDSHAQDAKDVKVDTTYDGDGRPVKDNKFDRECYDADFPEECTAGWFDYDPAYYLYSSVTGQKITTIIYGFNAGQDVYMGGTKIAFYTNYEDANYRLFTVTDPVTGSWVRVESDGSLPSGDSYRAELAGLGTSVPLTAPENFPPILNYENGYAGDSEGGCIMDGQMHSRRMCNDDIRAGIAEECPDNNCGPRLIGGRYTLPYGVGGSGWLTGTRTCVTIDGKTECTNDFVEPPDDGFHGGIPNAVTELGDCLFLSVPSYDKIDSRASKLLSNTFGDQARSSYNSWSIYSRAVFLNTAVGVAEVGGQLDNAKLVGEMFLVNHKNPTGVNTAGIRLPFGLWMDGVTGIDHPLLPGNLTAERIGNPGSLEVQKVGFFGRKFHYDFDLYQGPSKKHDSEMDFNRWHQRPTHPGDVIRALKMRDPGINTGVSCINIIPDLVIRRIGNEV